MNIKKDCIKIARAGLRGLYLQIVDYYTESIKTDSQINSFLLDYFKSFTEANENIGRQLSKDEASIQAFIDRMIQQQEPTPGLEEIEEQISSPFETLESTTKYLITQYETFGISVPPEGFLKIDYDVKEWWNFRTRFQNGYFIYTEVFKYDGKGNIKKSGFNNNDPYPFNPFTALTSEAVVIPDELKSFLLEKTKDEYLKYADQNNFTKIVDKSQMSNEYFFLLDEGKNSLSPVFVDSSGKSGKIYIRTFFNEYAQKLNLSIVEVQGVEDLKKVPGGIRKNYIVSNLFKAIKAFEKEARKKGNPKPSDQLIIDGLKQLERIIRKSIQKGTIGLSSRIGLIFNEEYEFLSCVDSENKLINNFELYKFLEDKTELNRYIARLNAINCRLSGGEVDTSITSIGDTPDNYSHFSVGNKPYKVETPEQKAANFKASRSALKFVGDVSLKQVFNQIKQQSPQAAGIAGMYETFLNRVDLSKLASDYAALKSKKLSLPDLRKVYFKAYINSLDITELVDCVVENAGAVQKVENITFPPSSDGSGAPGPDSEGIVTESRDSKNFELELKTLLYGKFAYFYNIAKSYDSQTFDFPSSDPKDELPSVKGLVDDLETISDELIPMREAFEELEQEQAERLAEIKKLNDNQSFEAANELEGIYFDKIADSNDLAAEIALKEQQFLDAQNALRKDQNKYFMYIVMIPESQTGKIFTTITTNDPQYKFKQPLIQNGMLAARDTPGFTPNNFIITLLRNEIIDYSNELSSDEFLDFFSNILDQNKKLKDMMEKKVETSENSKQSIGKRAKTSQTSLPEPFTFSAFNIRFPTFSLDLDMSKKLSDSLDDGISKSVEPMFNASKEAMDKGLNGDEEAYNGLDPSLTSQYLSNDPIQLVVDGPKTKYNSPSSIILQCKKQILPENSYQEINLLFQKVHLELTAPVQLKLMENSIDVNETTYEIVKELFFDSGIDNSYTTISKFFAWLRNILVESGGLDLLLQKIEEAKEAIFLNIDLCDDNGIDPNSAREATESILQVLSLLDASARNSNIPPFFSCDLIPGVKPVFNDFYSDVQKEVFNNTISGRIKTINSFFNDDISKFKPTILKQNLSMDELFLNLFASEEARDAAMLQFQRDVNKKVTSDLPAGEAPSDISINSYESQQKDLKAILNSAFAEFNATADFSINENNTDDYNRFIFSSNSIEYNMILANNNSTFKTIELEENKAYVVVVATDTDEIIFTQQIAEFPLLSFEELYSQFIATFNPLEFSASDNKNQLFEIDYPYVPKFVAGYESFLSKQIIKLLKGNGDISSALGIYLKAIMDSLLSQFFESADIFNNENFKNIPLKDTEAFELGKNKVDYNKNYLDGGILSTEEVFKTYKNLRKVYQCFTTPAAEPDAHQIANLKSMYELLFNTLIVEGVMRQFFVMGQNQLALSENAAMKAIIFEGIPKAFENSITRLGALQLDYKEDINLLYKFKVLEEKLADQINVEEDTWPDEWKYDDTQINEKMEYLAEEYYPKIIDKIQKRIKLSIPSFGTSDFNFSLVSYNKPPGIGKSFKIYNDVEFQNNAPIPVLTGLKKGVILQKYIDVRQNGAILDQIKLGTVATGKAKGLVIAPMSQGVNAEQQEKIKFNSRLYLPMMEFGLTENVTANYLNADFPETVSPNWTPAYTNAFFTRHDPTTPPDLRVDKLTAVPKIMSTLLLYNNQGNITTKNFMLDVDSAAYYEKAEEENENILYDGFNWATEFYRTQGCISFDDFFSSYSIMQNPSIATLYFLQNGPSMYIKKLRLGVRACLVLSVDELGSESFNEIKTKYLDKLKQQDDGPSPFSQLEKREIFKEKIGLYRNENGEEFIVMPIVKREKDLLPALQESWENDNDYFWFDDFYNNTVTAILLNDTEELENEVEGLLSTFSPTSMLKDVLPIFVNVLFEKEYGEKLSNIFNPTKQEILKMINLSKAVINGQWDFSADLLAGYKYTPLDGPAVNSSFDGDVALNGIGGNVEDSDMDIYVPLVLSFVPLLVGLLATFADPTWKTFWYHPGPTQPIGYIAKILNETSDNT